MSWIAKAVSLISRWFGLGAGVTWPGEISLKLNNKLITDLSQQIKKGIIIIAGTNGKTTTASMIYHTLSTTGAKVIHNATGANLLNGIAGTLILKTNFFGKLNCDYAIFEADEATLPLILAKITPHTIILLNLFRDQLDRYGEVDTIALKWSEALKKISNKSWVTRAGEPQQARKVREPRGSQSQGTSTCWGWRATGPATPVLIANADDPLIAYIGKNYQGKVYYFGLNDKKYDLGRLPHATDSIYCLRCGEKLKYASVFLSHFGNWQCLKCGLKRPKLDIADIFSPLDGVYNIYNTQAAILTVSQMGVSQDTARNILKSFQPAFGRQETFTVNGKKIQIFLSKNPAGFNESIRTVLVKNELKTVLFVLNDRIPDGTDVSWIWDVDFEEIVDRAETIICSGDRIYDMALRIKYSIQGQSSKVKAQNQNLKLKTYEKLEKALESGLQNTLKGGTLFIFPTYSAMLEIRKIITGRKIL